MDTENLTAAPKPQAPATSRVCAVPRSEYAESESFLSKFLREMEREKDRLPGWEELLLRELTWNSARYGWDAWETEENARRYEEAFNAYLQSVGCPEEDSAGNAWARLSTKPDTQADIEEFQRMAAFYEPADVNFWRPDLDDETSVPASEIDTTCHKLLGDKAKRGEHYSGCTVQGGIDATSIEPYIRPKSMTYFSKGWEGEELENVKSHELAHQLIITLGQLMGREIQRRRTLKLPTLSDDDAKTFKGDLDALTEILDKNETADWNPSTGKPHLRRKVDVLRELKKIHCRFLRKLYDLETWYQLVNATMLNLCKRYSFGVM